MMENVWKGYKRLFIEKDGRVLRPLNDYDTVSEGQAYAMLLAVWMDDREVFDRCYQWTEKNLSRLNKFNDHLLAWHWKEGVIDWNSASDADQDYAIALLFAGQRWNEELYKNKAIAVLSDILNKETGKASDGRLYILPGTWPVSNEDFIINPSYFSPAWYRIFYAVTGDSRWNELVDSSYHAILSLSKNLGDVKGVGLLPNWCKIDKNGRFMKAEKFDESFGWDAIRIPWRIGLDLLWFKEQRAKIYLAEILYDFYLNEWDKNQGKLMAEYNYDGTVHSNYESTATYAMSMFSFMAAESDKTELIMGKILQNYIHNGDIAFFGNDKDYYQNSLALFGLAAKTGISVNLANLF